MMEFFRSLKEFRDELTDIFLDDEAEEQRRKYFNEILTETERFKDLDERLHKKIASFEKRFNVRPNIIFMSSNVYHYLQMRIVGENLKNEIPKKPLLIATYMGLEVIVVHSKHNLIAPSWIDPEDLYHEQKAAGTGDAD